MSWSAAFQTQLAGSTTAPIFLLHVLKWAGTPGRQFYACSSAGYGVPEIMGMEAVVSGSNLSPMDWRYTAGTCTIQITATSIAGLAYSARRGSIAVLKMGFPGYDLADFEPVFMGRVATIQGSGPTWQLVLWDGTSILSSRLAVGAAAYRANQDNIFYAVGGGTDYKTTTTATYTAGVSTTLDLTDASVCEKLDGAGTTGAVYVDNGTDDPFFLTYTGVSGNQLTGVGTSDIFATVQATSSSGATVYNAAYLEGTPRVLFLRQLLSGSGTSSLYDKMPDSWGWAIPQDLVDVADVLNMQAGLNAGIASGNWTLEYVQTAQVTDSWEWLSAFWRTLGLIPIQRQGLLTLRPIQDPNDPTMTSGAHITDDHIEEVEQWVAYHPDMLAEFQQVEIFAGAHTPPAISDSTTFRTPETLPVADTVAYLANDKIYQNQTQILGEIKGRVGVWGPNIPEMVTIRCAGLRFAGLAPTEIVHLTTSGIYGGRINSTRDGYDRQPCMVLQCSPDFTRGSVVLTLAAIDPF